jgi:hypothetical protein
MDYITINDSEENIFYRYVSNMYPIYFDYKAESKQYFYIEGNVEYSMSLLLMLKFKRYFRENGYYTDYPLKSWVSTLSKEDLLSVNVKEASVLERNKRFGQHG